MSEPVFETKEEKIAYFQEQLNLVRQKACGFGLTSSSGRCPQLWYDHSNGGADSCRAKNSDECPRQGIHYYNAFHEIKIYLGELFNAEMKETK